MLEEVGNDTGLSYPGRTEQSNQPAGAVGDCVLVLAPESRSLALAADQHAVEVTRHGLRARYHVEQPEALDGLRLSLERKRIKALHSHGVADEQSRFRADQHVTCRGQLLEACCHVDGIP